VTVAGVVRAGAGRREIDMAKLMPMKDVANALGYSESKVYQMIRRNEFPAGRKMPTGGVRWLDDEVDAWIRQTYAQAQEVRLSPA